MDRSVRGIQAMQGLGRVRALHAVQRHPSRRTCESPIPASAFGRAVLGSAPHDRGWRLLVTTLLRAAGRFGSCANHKLTVLRLRRRQNLQRIIYAVGAGLISVGIVSVAGYLLSGIADPNYAPEIAFIQFAIAVGIAGIAGFHMDCLLIRFKRDWRNLAQRLPGVFRGRSSR